MPATYQCDRPSCDNLIRGSAPNFAFAFDQAQTDEGEEVEAEAMRLCSSCSVSLSEWWGAVSVERHELLHAGQG